MKLGLWCLLICLPALQAQPGENPRISAWAKQGSSLLYYDDQGELSLEIGLGRWEETSSSRINIKTISAGLSPQGRFAWTLETRLSWNSLKTNLLDSVRVLRFYGPTGKELWAEDAADTPTTGEPLVFSANGETCVMALKHPHNWAVAVKSYIGNTLWTISPIPRLESMSITPNGRYAMLRWNDPDKSAMHSFLEIPSKTRKDLPSDQFFLGQARIENSGEVFAGKKRIFSFNPSVPKPERGQDVSASTTTTSPAPKAHP